MFQDHRFHGCSHYDLRNHLPHDHRLGKLDDPIHLLVKSEIQLCHQLGMDKRLERRIRQKSLSKNSWKKIGNKIFYTNNGEHALRNEITKKIFADYANNR